eukprot:jgi/Chrzof1/14022/Cz08g21130.t1
MQPDTCDYFAWEAEVGQAAKKQNGATGAASAVTAPAVAGTGHLVNPGQSNHNQSAGAMCNQPQVDYVSESLYDQPSGVMYGADGPPSRHIHGNPLGGGPAGGMYGNLADVAAGVDLPGSHAAASTWSSQASDPTPAGKKMPTVSNPHAVHVSTTTTLTWVVDHT